MEYLYRENWSKHPILSRIGFKSDFDGDGMLHLSDYVDSEFELCSGIVIEVSEDGGSTWRSSTFSDDIIFIDDVGAGWAWLASYHPFDSFTRENDDLPVPLIRAKILIS
jgi:hypothetical protein